MQLSIPSSWRSVRLLVALSLVALAIVGSAALAQASPFPVDFGGGTGGDVVLPVEPDSGIGN